MIRYMRNKELADFLRKRMLELNLSAADVARRADNEISPTTVTKILNHEVKDSGSRTLAAIAKGIDVDSIDLFRIATGEDVNTPLHIRVYAKRLDADDISQSEWQYLELFFKQQVETFRFEKVAYRERIIAEFNERKKIIESKVPARIEPPIKTEMTRNEIQNSLENEAGTQPVRTRKTG